MEEFNSYRDINKSFNKKTNKENQFGILKNLNLN